LKPTLTDNVDTMIVGILGCLFSKNKVILQHFHNFEATFEKSSIISTILSNFILNTTKPFLINYKIYFSINRNCSEKTRTLSGRRFVHVNHEKLVLSQQRLHLNVFVIRW
jgi:hypothetical protein